jgi:hypothetical protein
MPLPDYGSTVIESRDHSGVEMAASPHGQGTPTVHRPRGSVLERLRALPPDMQLYPVPSHFEHKRSGGKQHTWDDERHLPEP